MALRIQHNIAALNAHRHLTITNKALSKSLERLSSGYRINRAADDAAGLAISEQFRADIASYRVASRNVTEATSMLQVAEGAMDQISQMLVRLKELATQAASANAAGNLDKINAEANKLIDEIDRIANSTEYAGRKLINGTFGVTVSGGTFTASDGLVTATGLESGVTYSITVTASGTGEVDITISATLGSGRVEQKVYDVDIPGTNETTEVDFDALGLTIKFNDNLAATATSTIIAHTATAADFQIGAKDSDNDRIGILLGNVKATDSNGLNLEKDQLLTADDAQAFMTTIDNAISTLNSRRGNIGAAQNRLSYAAANLSVTIENYTASESVIRDVDMAFEMTTYTKNQILLQAGTAMLAQANMAPQQILALFQ